MLLSQFARFLTISCASGLDYCKWRERVPGGEKGRERVAHARDNKQGSQMAFSWKKQNKMTESREDEIINVVDEVSTTFLF